MTRETFEQQIKDLQDSLLQMAGQVEEAIDLSVKALAERDAQLGEKIVLADEAVNRAQRDIDEKCLVLIATQQPLAGDLRVILAISGIATELERIGDHAKGIAELAVRMASQPLLKPLIDIPRMAEKGRWLLKQQLEAFLKRDGEMAKKLARQDDEIDALYDQIYRELLIFMMDDPRTITRATYLIWVAHNLERIGDRTTNIGERVVFMASGQVEELNPPPRVEG